MNNDLMFSSENQCWATRWETFKSIEEQLGRKYNLDPCCFEETAKCENFLTPKEDMFSVKNPLEHFLHLEQIQIFCNPEYGRAQAKFVEHIAEWCEYDNVVADVLIPAKTETKLFHEIVLPRASSVRFIKGRLTFGTDQYWEDIWEMPILPNGKKNSLFKVHGKTNAAPFPSMVVTFGEDKPFEYGTLITPKTKIKV